RSFVPPLVPGARTDTCGAACELNPDAARRLYAEAHGPDRLTITYNADGDHKAWVAAICDQLTAHLGVRCAAEPKPSLPDLLARVHYDRSLELLRLPQRRVRRPARGRGRRRLAGGGDREVSGGGGPARPGPAGDPGPVRSAHGGLLAPAGAGAAHPLGAHRPRRAAAALTHRAGRPRVPARPGLLPSGPEPVRARSG